MALLRKEPVLQVGIFDNYHELHGLFNGEFAVDNGQHVQGVFHVTNEDGMLVMRDEHGKEIGRGARIVCSPVQSGTFLLRDVIIGVKFHWERREDQTFPGRLRLVSRANHTITAINEIFLEDYLKSVISSEMSAESPVELLKAHAITSRSWLVAMLERSHKVTERVPALHGAHDGVPQLIRWYTREDHDTYDVCADDHCQRYQGITKIISTAVNDAIEATRGLFLVHENEICDARFYKSCGGLTDEFQNTWENEEIPYLRCVADSSIPHAPLRTEAEATAWILSAPDAYCNTKDPVLLRQILPSFDQETTDFFRWKISYEREELEALILKKSGSDFGKLVDLIPVERGPSGRLVRLKIVGTGDTLVIGKELEIRRWLSPSHLYSSAFIVRADRTESGEAHRFTFHGAGWGHGVGLCQIGAAVMAARGFDAPTILKHYFRGSSLNALYSQQRNRIPYE